VKPRDHARRVDAVPARLSLLATRPSPCSYGSRERGANASASVDFHFFFATPISRRFLGPLAGLLRRRPTQKVQGFADGERSCLERTRSRQMPIAPASSDLVRDRCRSLLLRTHSLETDADRSCFERPRSRQMPIAPASSDLARDRCRSLLLRTPSFETDADRSCFERPRSRQMAIAPASSVRRLRRGVRATREELCECGSSQSSWIVLARPSPECLRHGGTSRSRGDLPCELWLFRVWC